MTTPDCSEWRRVAAAAEQLTESELREVSGALAKAAVVYDGPSLAAGGTQTPVGRFLCTLAALLDVKAHSWGVAFEAIANQGEVGR